MDSLRTFVARSPKRWLVLGKAIFLAGAILIVGAVFARAALVNINTVRAAAKQPALHRLAEAYPQYPTWIVPEGPLGFSVAAVLVLVGLALTVLADGAIRNDRVRRGRR